MIKGLTAQEVSKRIQEGKLNKSRTNVEKSNKEIIISNTFTLFNGLNLCLAILVLYTGQLRNALFMLVVIFNTAIGIYQEIKAKKTLDKLAILSKPHAQVLRDGDIQTINGEDLVLDDIVVLKLGDQILSDGVVVDGQISVNEAILTGEARDIIKQTGDNLFAGSFITSGKALMKVEKVGKDNYIEHIIINAKKLKYQKSPLRDSLNMIIKFVMWLIIPLAGLLFFKQYLFYQQNLNDSILQVVASLIGMIPEGLVLLVSIALSVGVIKLAKENTLVHELYSLETLAHCNTLCLDKTGTLTSGRLKVVELIEVKNNDSANLIANIVHQINDNNPTANALKDYFKITKDIKAIKLEAFSSKTKKSALITADTTYELGALEYLEASISSTLQDIYSNKLSQGYRILALSRNKEVIALILITDEIRENAKATLDYFYKQGVDIRFISGDNPLTIKSTLNKINLFEDCEILDCSHLSDDELIKNVDNTSIFGRVSPDQKCLIIKELKKSRTVGMVGDGVNDVLALKTADFSAAMNDGAESAKAVANVVLLDNDFAHMPRIVDEGRRAINNIEKTASLFLSKTALSIFLSILSIFTFATYPFKPIQLTLISSLCIGIPSFCLTFEPNYNVVKGHFLSNVLAKAIPAGLAISITLFVAQFVCLKFETVATIITALVLLNVLITIVKPTNILHSALLLVAIAGLTVAILFLPHFFYLESLSINDFISTIILGLLATVIFKFSKDSNMTKNFS